MIEHVPVDEPVTLDDYEKYVTLRAQVERVRRAARRHAGSLEGHTVWMINSVRDGGGVAEMMPKLVAMLSELGVRTEWIVIRPEPPEFFALTKRIHNLIHGRDVPKPDGDDRALYESVSEDLSAALAEQIAPDDVVVVHDPQPAGAGALLRRDHGVSAIWRSHIGLDRRTQETEAGWAFLRPWLEAYDRTVFTIGAYAPTYLEEVEIARPGIDPLSHKNRKLSIHKHAGILVNASLSSTVHPAVSPPFEDPALRLQEDGSFAPATQPEGLGLMFRPVLTQVSRWDRLKGFGPLLEGFARLKRKAAADGRDRADRHRRRLELARLVLAGPDPEAVDDDPEGREVFSDLCDRWLELPPDLRRDVAIVRLPMESRKVNALMVNVLQRSSVAVVQNSLEEGFGLTVTEAMWKGVPVLGSTAAGIAAQIEDGQTGRLIEDPEDPTGIANRLDEMLEREKEADAWATNARRNVTDRYLVTAQVARWLELLDETVTRTQNEP